MEKNEEKKHLNFFLISNYINRNDNFLRTGEIKLDPNVHINNKDCKQQDNVIERNGR
jgi:hypothetical protein